MANLLGQNIGTNYKGILNLDTINTPLDATLRAVTDGEGNASLLELSTTAVSVGAISGARFAIKGSGTTFATNSLLVQNSAGTDLLKIRDDGQITCAGAIQAAGIIGTTYGLFGGASYLSASVGIKGSGTTSATTSLLVQNSAGNSALTILDNLNSQFGGTVTSDGGFRSIAYFDSFQRVALNNGLNTNPQNYLISGGVGRILLIDNTEADFNRLQFGGTTSSFPSLKRNGTAIDVRLADDSNYAQFNTGATFIKGSGTTSSTTALLVQNSAGTAALTVKDDLQVAFSGIVTFDNNLTLNGANGTSSLNNLRFIVPGATKSFVINADYSFANQASALLEVQSTTKGFLPPRMTTTQKNAIATPASGLIVYDETTNKLACYNGTTWNDLF
jgi:hypothetical protein